MSTLDPDNDPTLPATPAGNDTEALGPSDSSDTGSDALGAKRHDFDRDTELDEHALQGGEEEAASDTDRAGTGERASADGDENLRPDSDVLPDRVGEAGEIGELGDVGELGATADAGETGEVDENGEPRQTGEPGDDADEI